MINRLAKAQKSWIAKLILTLTALSFVSLFGVTEYISRAGANRTVIKVDNIEISKDQFTHQLQKELNDARKMLDEDAQLSEELQAELIQDQIQKTVRNAVLDRTAQKYHIAFRQPLLNSLILNQPVFRDASGNFNSEAYRRYLSETGLTEGELLANLRRDLVRRLVVDLPVVGFNVPEPLIQALAKVDNKRRSFKYIEISPENVKVDRQISAEEIDQYYEDFAPNFMEPERRDVKLLYLPASEIADKIEVSEDEVKAFYDEHKTDYETPQTRHVLQMMFDNAEDAQAAYQALQNGKEFFDVAAEFAGQSENDTDLGFVAEDELVFELAEPVFGLNNGGFTEPVEDGEIWRIMKVADIKEGSKVAYDQAAAEITQILKEENLYSGFYELTSKIEDKLAAGFSLEDIAAEMNTTLAGVKGLAEDGSLTYVAPQLKPVVQTSDFADTVFSYALGETSQVVETDDGLAVVRIENIVPEHPKAISEVQEEIRQLWLQNEKTAIVQEMVNDVMHDLESDGDISQIGKQYGLDVYRPRPISRNETFAGINYPEIREMFAEPLNTPRQIQQGDKYIIAIADQDYKNSAPLSEQERNMIKFNATMSMLNDMTSAMLASYAADYDIRIKYKLLGLED